MEINPNTPAINGNTGVVPPWLTTPVLPKPFDPVAYVRQHPSVSPPSGSGRPRTAQRAGALKISAQGVGGSRIAISRF